MLSIVERRFFDRRGGSENGHKWRCIRRVNGLIISLNLSYLTSTIIDHKVSTLQLKELLPVKNALYFANTRLPRTFTSNPL